LSDALLADTLGVLLKYEEDVAAVRASLGADISAVPPAPRSLSR
jgi:hypothetical protein